MLPRIDRHSYQCLDCARRFWDRPHRRQSYAPPPPVDEGEARAHRRRRPRWRVEGTPETTPYSRARIYLAIGLAWVVLLALFIVLRALWPAGEAVVRSVD